MFRRTKRWRAPRPKQLAYHLVPKAVGSPKNDTPNLVGPIP